MLTYGFYNSKDHDRVYDAIQLASIFDGIINDGIFMSIGDHLQVTSTNRMTVLVGTGRAWFNHSWILNDSPFPILIPTSEIILKRIDAIVLEVNGKNRINDIKVIKGTPSNNPVKPTLINTSEVHQYALAYIHVNENVTSIGQANIENAIGTNNAPFVTGILDTINIDSLVAQWGAQWDDWSSNITKEFTKWAQRLHDILDEPTAGNLALRIMELEDQDANRETEVQEIQNTVNVHTNSITELTNGVNSNAENITNLTNTVGSQAENLNELTTTVSSHTIDISELKNNLQILDGKVVKSEPTSGQSQIKNVVFVSSLPSDASSHPDTLYLIPE